MKKQLFNALLFCLMAVPFGQLNADTVERGQSTEGRDFWVTFMQADQTQSTSKGKPTGDLPEDNYYNTLILSLSISAREDCEVTISNPFTSYTETVNVTANEMKLVELYSGHPVASNARAKMAESQKVCYAVNSETVDTCALHVTSTKDIALFATNYKKATFDATNVLPTPSLLDEYIIQAYTPSDHGGTAQGSHFAVIATEDNTTLTYRPSVVMPKDRDGYNEYLRYKTLFWEDDPWISPEQKQKEAEKYEELKAVWESYVVGEKTDTVTLNQGEVYYVWTGVGDSVDFDLSGTYVKADKNIAVFQGCPHTNIPYLVKERDHIFSQAMPTQYWGNTFVLTSSEGRHKDFVRIMALHDGTEVRINGVVVHTFNFATDTKHYWEFTIGDQGTYAQNGSCLVTTSCACAVHLFLASKQADNVDNGDPAMLWVNPIEQQIDQVTFATYASRQKYSEDKDGHKKGDPMPTHHYVNIVTDQPDSMTLDGSKFTTGEFKPVSGSSVYYYAKKSLGNEARSHTLKSNGGNFIAHVYGFTSNESYGYSAGGATKPLSQSIYINGEEFSPDKENKLCGTDTVKFACKPDFMPDSIIWHFGDGTPDVVLVQDTNAVVPHYYQKGGDYDASCSIYRNSSNVCVGQSAVSVIKIKVTIGRYEFTIGKANIPCPENGVQQPGRIPYTSTIDLKGNNVTVDFDAAAKAAGFTQNDIDVKSGYFELNIPSTAEVAVPYGIHIQITSSCGDKDTTMIFQLPVGNDVITQRYNNVLGLLDDPLFEGLTLSDFQWYRRSDSTAIEGQVSSNLNMYDLPENVYSKDEFYVCYTINKGKSDERYTCACAKGFDTSAKEHEFEANPDSLIITANYDIKDDMIFVNANWGGKKDIECYAQWINASGNIYGDLKFNIPNGGCTIPTPNDNGLYLLRVYTDGKTRSFKFIINK